MNPMIKPVRYHVLVINDKKDILRDYVFNGDYNQEQDIAKRAINRVSNQEGFAIIVESRSTSTGKIIKDLEFNY